MATKSKKTPQRRSARRKTITPPSTRKPVAPTGFGLSTEALERSLLTGENPGLLQDYFGPENYGALRDLSRDTATRTVRGGPRVLILPGIMGSTLARKGLLQRDDTLWIDPIEIAMGKLTELKLDGSPSRFYAAGVVLLAYLKIKLRLRIAGFDADFFAYDWRRSLADLGKDLAEAIRREPSPVNLVAHSMGGLVARAALKASGKKVTRLVMLGTPNYGSFAPAQVIRGTYDVVQKIAKLDLAHNAEELCSEVFNTFPGLYEMLPSPEQFGGVNLYDRGAWPQNGPQPRAQLLSAVKPVIDNLAPADSRFFLIAGVNQDTVTSLRVENGDFVYEFSPDGDGTVPLAFARLAGIPENQIYYVEEGHGGLPNNDAVEAAVADLLSRGSTTVLSNERPPARRAARTISEPEVQQAVLKALGPGRFGSADYRHLLDSVAAPPRLEPAAAATVIAPAGAVPGVTTATLIENFQNLTIGRRRQRRIELTLAHGSITDVDSRAYVLGVFRNVAPSGAAKAVDERLDGAITEFTARRMFNGDVGAVFTVPVGRNQVAADMVLFAGLGAFDRFNADVQQLVAENVIRVLVRSRVEEFATVLIGAGSGQSPASVLQNLLIGFFRGLKDADPQHRFRNITLCESDAARFGEMKTALYRLAGTSLFEEVELTLDEMVVPPSERPSPRVLEAMPEPIYTIVRQEGQSAGRLHYRISILGAGMKAAVVSAGRDVATSELSALLQKFDHAVGPEGNTQDVAALGKEFASLVLPAEICTVLESLKDRHVVVVHDAAAARIPWETLTINNWSASVGAGLSRRYLADNLPIATWLEERRANPTLKLLLVVNPLGDLAGADAEGDRLSKLAAATSGIEVTALRRDKATKLAILSALRTGSFDCVHYAGHAFFDPSGPGRSGLICAGREILSGVDVMGISNLPFLVFFNACEAGRVRGVPRRPVKPASVRAAESFGVAEALMRGGIANYMSTYWPVGDQAAEEFANAFYKDLLAGKPLGIALLEGRKAVLAIKQRDWADYILYGSFDFLLKQRM